MTDNAKTESEPNSVPDPGSFSSLLLALRDVHKRPIAETFWFLVHHQFVRFLVVGGLNTLFAYVTFSLALFVGFHYAVASLISIVLNILVSFKTQGRFVFHVQGNSRVFRFATVAVVAYCTHTLLLKGAKHLEWNLYIAGAVLTVPFALLSFVLNRRFVFRTEDESEK